MSTLRNYLGYDGGRPRDGVRAAAQAWANRSISVRGLLAGTRVIHLSDLHFTDSAHTWDWADDGIVRDNQDSAAKAATLRAMLLARRSDLGTGHIVITGDLTDAGGSGDYERVEAFLEQLRGDGFMVSVVPGNHDCAWEGNLFFEDVFDAMANIGEAEVAAAVSAALLLGIPPSVTISAIKAKKVKDIVDDFLPGVPGAEALVPALCGLFAAAWPILPLTGTDTASNRERRARFVKYAAPGQTAYPVKVPVAAGTTLVLLDSMQGQFEGPRDAYAQGRLGPAQLEALDHDLAAEQEKGNKVIVCLHHSPLHAVANAQAPLVEDPKGGLHDAAEFWTVVAGRVDAVLFGHTTPAGTHQQPRKACGDDSPFEDAERLYGVRLLNCLNLEHVDDGALPACPVTVIDLGANRRATYDALSPAAAPAISWGIAPT